jgi:hypothetical protein
MVLRETLPQRPLPESCHCSTRCEVGQRRLQRRKIPDPAGASEPRNQFRVDCNRRASPTDARPRTKLPDDSSVGVRGVTMQSSLLQWAPERRPRDESGHAGLMHAKAAVADSRVEFLTSANLAEAALESAAAFSPSRVHEMSAWQTVWVSITPADASSRDSRFMEILLQHRSCGEAITDQRIPSSGRQLRVESRSWCG